MTKSQLDPAPRSDGILRRIRRFRRHQKGIAAMEFALIAPIMFGTYFMLNETASAMRAKRKITMVANVIADLASRPTDLSDADIDDIVLAAPHILSPFSSISGAYRISSIKFDNTGNGYVDWSEVRGSGKLGAAHARCTPTEFRPSKPNLTHISVPAEVKLPDTSVIVVEALLAYTPVVGQNIVGTINLQDKLYRAPRLAKSGVTRNGVVSLPCIF
ncbi:MAG: pilus assembly protein [Methylocystis sp.]|nr:pilus assembly protein [Methylocystis sp.]MCA3583325.1 pilus assembly protein [Methylocystis sp.]MCA3588812.1 pilus assembly protein [Methylocystis sp.]MCA3591844.1 pilus assembly protein [Methylocystis sp.]